ncbi:MAG: hypothetical protein ABII22_01380 [Candidatus Micrarchaeota archaeon]
MCARVISLADRLHARASRGQRAPLDRSDFLHRVVLDEYSAFQPCDHPQRLMPVHAFEPGNARQVVSRLSNLPEGLPNVFTGGQSIQRFSGEVRSLAARNRSDFLTELAELYRVGEVSSPFIISSTTDVLNFRFQMELNGIQNAEELVTTRRRPFDGSILTSPVELAIIACAVARMANYDAFLAKLDVGYIRYAFDGTEPHYMFHVQPVLGVCFIDHEGIVQTYLPAIPRIEMDQVTPVFDDGGEFQGFQEKITQYSDFISPHTHLPVGAFEILSDCAAFAIANISQSDLNKFLLTVDLERSGGIRHPVFNRQGMPFETMLQRFRDEVMKPLKDSLYLLPEFDSLQETLVSHLNEVMSAYFHRFTVTRTSELLKLLFETVRVGFEAMEQPAALSETVKQMHTTIRINTLQRGRPRDFILFDGTIRNALSEHFPEYDTGKYMKEMLGVEIQKPDFHIVR